MPAEGQGALLKRVGGGSPAEGPDAQQPLPEHTAYTLLLSGCF